MPPRRPSPDSLLHAESLAFGCSCGRHRQLGISTRRVGDQAPGPCCRQSGRGEPRQPPCQPSPGRLPSRRPSSSCRSPTAQTHRRPPRGAHCMDCQVFHLAPAFELEPHQVTEVLRLLLHTIIFQRALGPVKPQERDSELFDVTWVRVSGAAATYAEGLAGRRKAGRALTAAATGQPPLGRRSRRRSFPASPLPTRRASACTQPGSQNMPQPGHAWCRRSLGACRSSAATQRCLAAWTSTSPSSSPGCSATRASAGRCARAWQVGSCGQQACWRTARNDAPPLLAKCDWARRAA